MFLLQVTLITDATFFTLIARVYMDMAEGEMRVPTSSPDRTHH
jgi:hypothetical protein